ncbi:MAG: copper chaperone PCu(A)C [Pseudomonadota bacterium]
MLFPLRFTANRRNESKLTKDMDFDMRFSIRWLLAIALFALIAGLTAAAPQLFAKDARQTVVIEQAWSRATPDGARVAAGYLKIKNTGTENDTLLRVTSSASAEAQIHEMSMDNGLMKMRALPTTGLEIKPGETMELKPGGMHIMFMNIGAPLKQDTSVDAVLTFAKAGDVKVKFAVGIVGATSAPQPTH